MISTVLSEFSAFSLNDSQFLVILCSYSKSLFYDTISRLFTISFVSVSCKARKTTGGNKKRKTTHNKVAINYYISVLNITFF